MAWAAIVPVLLAILWAGYRVYIYRKALRYSPSTSSSYDLPEGLPVTIEEDRFVGLPNKAQAGVLLLALEVRATLLGHLFDPCVRIGEHEYCLERGVQGRRHLVVPSDARPTIQGRHVRIERKAEAWLYPAQDAKTMAIVAPHPDDAEIAAFGVYRAHPDRVFILNVTRGELGDSHQASGLDATARQKLVGDLRAFDARTVPLLAGVPPDRLLNLDWKESAFPLGEDARRELDRAIAAFLAESGAKQIVCPHPLLDNHKVHRDVTLATIEAILSLGDPEIELFASLIHVPGRRCYPLGPMDGPIDLPPMAGGKAFDRLEAHWLSPDDRVLKVFALDANHDLRGSPAPYAEETGLATLARRRTRQWLTGVSRVASSDYYRRSVRACELFLVYSSSSLSELAERLRTSS